MRLRRKPKQTNCPICNGLLTRNNGKCICESCRVEIKGSSVKPLIDGAGYDFPETRLNG